MCQKGASPFSLMSVPTPIQDAPTPFSGAADRENGGRPADFILRSSDGIDFHTHKEMLKFVSDFFDDMFSFPTGNEDPQQLFRDGKPVLIFPEPATVLQRLLQLAYPAHSGPAIYQYTLMGSDLDGIVDVHAAAKKYQFTCVQLLLEQMVDNMVLMYGQPHRLFAIARLWDLPDLARKAAVETLRLPVYPAPAAFPEMALLTWSDASKLHEFHHSCGLLAEKIAVFNAQNPESLFNLGGAGDPVLEARWRGLATFVWYQSAGHSAECNGRPLALATLRRQVAVPWFQRHVTRLSAQLRTAPSRDTVLAETVNVTPAERAAINACSVCSKNADRDLAIFANLLGSDIEKANSWIGESSVILPLPSSRSHQSLKRRGICDAAAVPRF